MNGNQTKRRKKIEQLANIEKAVLEVKKATSNKERIRIIRKYMAGTCDLDDKLQKEILNRRAIFCSELAKLGLWPDDERDDKIGKKDISLV